MALRTAVESDQAPLSPLYSQAIVCNGMMYVSGNLGMYRENRTLVEGSVADRTVCPASPRHGQLSMSSKLLPQFYHLAADHLHSAKR